MDPLIIPQPDTIPVSYTRTPEFMDFDTRHVSCSCSSSLKNDFPKTTRPSKVHPLAISIYSHIVANKYKCKVDEILFDGPNILDIVSIDS